MTPDRDDTHLHTLLGDLESPTGLAARIVQGARARRSVDETPAFDVVASERGVTRVRIGRGLTSAPSAHARALAERARTQLTQYLAGERAVFTVPVDLGAVPDFQRRVLRAALAIPFGAVRPYAWVAARIGHARAVRAVGTALGANPLPLLVPCHRVVRSDGALGGYIFGLPLKERLLALEHETPLYVGCTSTRILCVRGCAHERRMRPDRRVVFASVADARSVGYRPCAVCDVTTVAAAPHRRERKSR
jgi:methylated-DNA-[protein]-cysteine S-methyltransferase